MMEKEYQTCSGVKKSRVLDVKPLRSWAPVFPKSVKSISSDAQQKHSNKCANGGGGGGSRLCKFLPFGNVDGSQLKSIPAPVRSYKSAEAFLAGLFRVDNASEVNVSETVVTNRLNDGSMKRQRTVMTTIVNFDTSKREHGDAETVEYVMKMFNAVRRKLSQLEEAKEVLTTLKNRSDSKAGNILMTKGIRTNMSKRIGTVPGVEVGDIFSFRIEMCLVGLHGQTMAGIDYLKGSSEDDSLALSIVSSGAYDDEVEDNNILIYTGHGGISKKQVIDQKLEKGNLALEKSMHRGNEVRVIRGFKDPMNPSVKVYVYDGLYIVRESWIEKGKIGGNIFKFKLVRLPDQRSAYSVWKSVEKWKQCRGARPGVIHTDITSGTEAQPVLVVNEVDDDKTPSYFTYHPTLKYSKPYICTKLSLGCSCYSCTPGDLNCSCIRKNDGDFPYLGNGILVSRRAMLYECSPSCPCFSNCRNRVSQTGLKFHFEVFKTVDRGWGLRSWDPIRAGEFVCELAGEVINTVTVKKDDDDDEDYIFNTSRNNCNSLRWNYDPSLLDEEDHSDERNEDYEIPIPLTINAKKLGNVARFMNHSCGPNVFWQPVMYEVHEEVFLHIAFFAIRNIPPMTELTFDYGSSRSLTDCRNMKMCLCKSANCRGSFG